MKFSTIATLSAALLAAGVLAQDSTQNQLYFAIFGFNKEEGTATSFIADQIAAAKQKWINDHDHDTPTHIISETSQMSSLGYTFWAECATSQSSMIPVVPVSIFEKSRKGVSEHDRKQYLDRVADLTKDATNPYEDEEVIKLVNELYQQFFVKHHIGESFWFSTTAELMKKPECNEKGLQGHLDGDDFKDERFNTVLRLNKVKLNSKQWETCVVNGTPVCENLGEVDPEAQKAINDACVACKLGENGNNAMVASLVGAAALVALGLFF